MMPKKDGKELMMPKKHTKELMMRKVADYYRKKREKQRKHNERELIRLKILSQLRTQEHTNKKRIVDAVKLQAHEAEFQESQNKACNDNPCMLATEQCRLSSEAPFYTCVDACIGFDAHTCASNEKCAGVHHEAKCVDACYMHSACDYASWTSGCVGVNHKPTCASMLTQLFPPSCMPLSSFSLFFPTRPSFFVLLHLVFLFRSSLSRSSVVALPFVFATTSLVYSSNVHTICLDTDPCKTLSGNSTGVAVCQARGEFCVADKDELTKFRCSSKFRFMRDLFFS